MFGKERVRLGYYKDRTYHGILDTYSHAVNEAGDVAKTLSIASDRNENSRYINRSDIWKPADLYINDSHKRSEYAISSLNGGNKSGLIAELARLDRALTSARARNQSSYIINEILAERALIVKQLSELKDGVPKKDYQSDLIPDLDAIITDINKSFGIDNRGDGIKSSIKREMTRYNRFKVPEINLAMSKCYGHVFFTRPSCNILDDNRELNSDISNHPVFLYANNTCKGLLEELTGIGPAGSTDDFNMLLSNTTKGFSLNDETLQTTTYGTTFSGYKLSFGKDDIESKTAGEFSTSFEDDKRIHKYRFMKLWVEYITGVYRGKIIPTEFNELNKIIDYACSCYYILTAEDGETILFWSKYFGVYPTTIPSSQYSWQHGQMLTPNDIQVNFAYSWKQDFDPRDLIAFNYNAHIADTEYKYVKTYDTDLLIPGSTWVGTPFIEFVDDGVNEPCYKLRFRV